MRSSKQVIVIRSDLRMRRGKECAQAAHASMAWLTRRIRRAQLYEHTTAVTFSEAEQHWLDNSYAKVTVRVRSEDELLKVMRDAFTAGLECQLITDAGRTEFHGEPTFTAVAVGPGWSEDIDAVTGHLELY